jgi:hypothetical protein
MTLNYRDKGQPGSIESMMAKLFVYLRSFFAQLELNRFKTRALDGHRVLRQTDRWASGVPPLGFRVVPHPSGKGKGRDTDPEGRDLLHGMASRLLGGWSFIRIAAWLNEFGALTNMDRATVATACVEPAGHMSALRTCSCRCRSAVPGCFLSELYAGGDSEFGVDVGEVGLHSAW